MDNLSEVLIAVLGLIIIIGAIILIYKTYSNQDYVNAQNTLNVIQGKIDALKDGESGNFVIRGVDGWSLVGWSENDKTRPDKCYFKGCLCICKISYLSTNPMVDSSSSLASSQLEKLKVGYASVCQGSNTGICRDFGKSEVVVRTFDYYQTTQEARNVFPIMDYVVLPSKLVQIPINKSLNSIEIVQYTDGYKSFGK